MVSKTWYSTSSRDFSYKCFNNLQNYNKKNIKITRFITRYKITRELLTEKLLGLLEKTTKPYQNLQRNRHNCHSEK